MAKYVAMVEQADTGFSVYFPDLPGCTSTGSNLEEAFSNAADALAEHVALSREAGELLPDPSSLASLDALLGEMAHVSV